MKSNETIVTNTRRPSRMEVDDEDTTEDDDIPFSTLTIEDDLILLPLLGIINGALP